MHEQMGEFWQRGGNYKEKNLMEILQIKSTVTDMKLILDGHASRVNTAKERISGLEEKSAEIIQVKTQKGKSQNKASESCETMSWDIMEYRTI